MKRPVAKISNHSRRLRRLSDVIDHSRRSPTFASRCFASSLNAPLPRIVIRTLPAVPVDNIHWISIISFFTALPRSLYAYLSLALGYTFNFQFLIQTVRCGLTVGSLQNSSCPPIQHPSIKSLQQYHLPQPIL